MRLMSRVMRTWEGQTFGRVLLERLASMEKIELIAYHQVLTHRAIRFWCYNAGHVLGACMFMIEIAGVRVLYTGDFSRQVLPAPATIVPVP